MGFEVVALPSINNDKVEYSYIGLPTRVESDKGKCSPFGIFFLESKNQFESMMELNGELL
jgi:hypothetical protein